MKAVVIGGGVSGLSAAYFLSQSGVSCTLIEQESRLGGVIRTDRVEGCVVEAGPDSFISQKPAAAELARELGLGDQLIGSNDARRKTFVLRNGRLVPLPDGIQFLAPTKAAPIVATGLLSPSTKLRMALEYFRRPLERKADCSVSDFVRDHYGAEAVEYLAQPMLAGVYGGAPEDLSIASVLPRFLELEKRYGSLSRGMLKAMRSATGERPGGPLFQTLKGGMSQLTETLADRIRGRVSTLHAKAVAVRPTASGWEVQTEGETVACDHVVIGAPTYCAAELIEAAAPRLAETLRAIRYHSSITAALIYRRPDFERPLDGFGFLVPRAEGRLIGACTWVNTKFDHRAPDDRPLLRAFIAGKKAEARLESTDDEIVDRMHNELREIMGFDAEPIAALVHRWPRAMAQYEVGHAERVRSVEERARALPGLHLGGNGFDGIGVPDCVRRSRAIADRIAAS